LAPRGVSDQHPLAAASKSVPTLATDVP
jgi:hypothetical protein